MSNFLNNKKLILLLIFIPFIYSCSDVDENDNNSLNDEEILIDYFKLFSGINKETSHFQPNNIPFTDYSEIINYNLPEFSCETIISAYGNFNSNSLSDLILSKGDCLTEDNCQIYIVIDDQIQYSFVSPQAFTRKFLIGDIDKNGLEDIVLIGTGIDTDPYTGDSTHIILMFDNNYQLLELDPELGYFHTGAMGDLNNDGNLDILPFNNQAFNNVNPDLVPVFLGNGNGTFEKIYSNIPYHRIASMFHSELFDINGDGILDLIMGGHEWEADWYSDALDTVFWRNGIYLGKGNGNFDLENRILMPKVDGWGIMTDFDVYDLNNDGVWEIIVTRTSGTGNEPMVTNNKNYDGIKIQILEFKDNQISETSILNQPETWFSDPNMWIEWPQKTLVFDVNRDGLLDLIPESDHINSSTYQPTLRYKGLYYQQNISGDFDINYHK